MAFVNYLKIGEKNRQIAESNKILGKNKNPGFLGRSQKFDEIPWLILVNFKSTRSFRQFFVNFLENLTCNIWFI